MVRMKAMTFSAVLRLLQADKGHLAALHDLARLGEIGIEPLIGPLAAERQHPLGIFEALAHADIRADDVPEIGSDALLPALVDGVAGLALVPDLLAFLEVGSRQTVRKVLVGLRGIGRPDQREAPAKALFRFRCRGGFPDRLLAVRFRRQGGLRLGFALLFRLRGVAFRQRLRRGGERAQIGDEIGPVAGLLQPDEGHLGALEEPLRLEEEGVEIGVVPLARMLGHRVRISEAFAGRDIRADDVVEVRPLLRRPAFVEGMAGGAFLGDRLAARDIGLGQHACDGLGARRFGPRRGNGGGDVRPMRFGAVPAVRFRDQSIAENADKDGHNPGQQEPARDFVDLEKIHASSSS